MVKIVMGKKPADKKPEPAMPIEPDPSGIGRRVKMTEERITNMRSRVTLIEQNMIAKNKTFFSEIKTLNLELTEVKKEIYEVKDRMLVLVKELENFARREEVEITRKYVDLWSPAKFVSRNEVAAIVAETIEKLRKQ